MQLLQGFRTIIFNIVAVASSWAAIRFNVEICEESQAAIATTIIAIINILLRIITKTPIGKKEDK